MSRVDLIRILNRELNLWRITRPIAINTMILTKIYYRRAVGNVELMVKFRNNEFSEFLLYISPVFHDISMYVANKLTTFEFVRNFYERFD